MTTSLKIYIGQQLKNNSYRKKHNKRISAIMSQIKYQQLDEEFSNDRKIEQLDNITSEFKGKNRSKWKRYSELGRVQNDNIDIDFDKKYIEHRLSMGSRSKNKTNKNSKLVRAGKLRKLKCNYSCRGLGQLINAKPKYKNIKQNSIRQSQLKQTNPNFRISFKQKHPIHQKLKFLKQTSINSTNSDNLSIYLQKQREKVSLENQNIHKLNSFIRGAYESQINQLSNVINLSIIDRYRRDFQIYDKLYNQMVEMNTENKLSLGQIKHQNFRDIVFINQMKNHASAPQFLEVLKQLNIIK